MDWLVLVVGLTVLLVGAELVVRGAVALAQSVGVSSLAIGMSVVAFGTSAPELAVNVTAAFNNQSSLTFGNILGSNIANVGLIVGLTASVKMLQVHRSIVTREIPIMLVATLGMILLASDSMLGGSVNVIDRLDGILLLTGFAVFIYMSVHLLLNGRDEDTFLQEADSRQMRHHWARALLLTVLGLGGIGVGSRWTVEGAVSIAHSLGINEVVVGLSIVAVGTSLPEMATSLMAVRSNHSDLAVGNIVGSNIFNILFILAISAAIGPVVIPPGGYYDLLALACFSAVLLPIAITHQRRIVRTEGILLLIAYVSYLLWRTMSKWPV